MYRCARLRGLDSSEGLFLFGRSHFYVIDGFTLLTTEGNKGTGDIRDIDSLPEGYLIMMLFLPAPNQTRNLLHISSSFKVLSETEQSFLFFVFSRAFAISLSPVGKNKQSNLRLHCLVPSYLESSPRSKNIPTGYIYIKISVGVQRKTVPNSS